MTSLFSTSAYESNKPKFVKLECTNGPESVFRPPRIPLAEESDERKALRNELRAEARQARSEMPAPYRAYKSSELCKRLEESLTLTLDITGINASDAIVAVYSAFPEEVDLHDFIETAYAQGCTVAFPCMVKDAWGTGCTQQTMEMRSVPAELWRSNQVPFLNNPLKRYSHDDEELQLYPYVSANELTMITVPVVGFDTRGNRLGYGAGNYDRYLTQIAQFDKENNSKDHRSNNCCYNCRIVGVAFAEQQVDDIPTEEHDIPLAILSL